MFYFHSSKWRLSIIWRKKLDAKNYFDSFHFIVKMKSLNNFKDKTWIKVLQTQKTHVPLENKLSTKFWKRFSTIFLVHFEKSPKFSHLISICCVFPEIKEIQSYLQKRNQNWTLLFCCTGQMIHRWWLRKLSRAQI